DLASASACSFSDSSSGHTSTPFAFTLANQSACSFSCCALLSFRPGRRVVTRSRDLEIFGCGFGVSESVDAGVSLSVVLAHNRADDTHAHIRAVTKTTETLGIPSV